MARLTTILAGYKLQGHTTFQGLQIAIENQKGSVRKGVDHRTGKPWRTVMKNPYGYIVGSKGLDNQPLDCYLGPDEGARFAYVVHQLDPHTGNWDEDKVMLGWRDPLQAKEAYLAHYDNPAFFGDISAVPMEDFKKKVEQSAKNPTKISAAKTLEASIAFYNLTAGGPGSGCHGDNCGRKPYEEWSQEEKNRDWAERHKLPIDGQNRVRLYHATPLSSAGTIEREGLRTGSFLADDPVTALQQAGRDRGLKAGKLAVYEAYIPLGTFHGGTWAQTMQDHTPAAISLRRVTSKIKASSELKIGDPVTVDGFQGRGVVDKLQSDGRVRVRFWDNMYISRDSRYVHKMTENTVNKMWRDDNQHELNSAKEWSELNEGGPVDNRAVEGARIEQVGTQFCVRSDVGVDKNFGCYPSREEAQMHVPNSIEAGGPGSGCNPAVGKCGRPKTTSDIANSVKAFAKKFGVKAIMPTEKNVYKWDSCVDSKGAKACAESLPIARLADHLGLKLKDFENLHDLVEDWLESPNKTLMRAAQDVVSGHPSTPTSRALALQHAITQVALGGHKYVKLYRGVTGQYASGIFKQAINSPGKSLTVRTHGADSWTTEKSIAKSFGDMVIKARVPKEYIVASPKSNQAINQYGEHEYIVAWPKGRFNVDKKALRAYFSGGDYDFAADDPEPVPAEPDDTEDSLEVDLTDEPNTNWLRKVRDNLRQDKRQKGHQDLSAGRGIEHFGITKADKEILSRIGDDWTHGGKISKRAILLARAGYLQRKDFHFKLTPKGRAALHGHEVQCGGPGSGCHGDNCGRHKSALKEFGLKKTKWGYEGKVPGRPVRLLVKVKNDGSWELHEGYLGTGKYHAKYVSYDKMAEGSGADSLRTALANASKAKDVDSAGLQSPGQKQSGWQYGFKYPTGYIPQRQLVGLPKVRRGGGAGAPKIGPSLGKPAVPKLRTPAPGVSRPNVSLKQPKSSLKSPGVSVAHPYMPKANVGAQPKRPSFPRPQIKFSGYGEPMTGNMSHVHIDPAVWFHPPSLADKEDNEDLRVPTDDPGETNDKFLDVTKRNDPKTEEMRMKLLQRQAPQGEIPVRQALVAPHTAVYQPGMYGSGVRLKQRPARIIGSKRTFVSYKRRGCI